MSKVREINTSQFESEVLGTDSPVLVDFWAPWCGPCRAVAPVLDKLADARSDAIVVKVNVDDNPQLAARYGVRSIPTVLLFNAGELKDTLIGAQPGAAYEKALDRLTSAA
ncbi:MAG: thioredoxin [Xanthomonadales bacterium]|nr:thioredoxin [Xanthomonadales bacterium]